MGTSSQPSVLSSQIDLLLAGPRGRRLCLEFALDPRHAAQSLRLAAFQASYELDPGKGVSVVQLRHPDYVDPQPTPTPADVADELRSAELAEVTPDLLRWCLTRSVDMARYWQEPEGLDFLAATEEVLGELRNVAAHVLASPLTHAWVDPLDSQNQWSIPWDHADINADTAPHPIAPADKVLAKVRAELVEEEERAVRERPTDPTAPYSGTWWSFPDYRLLRTSPETFDTSPAGLWFVEDSFGQERALAFRLGAPANLRVYEIDSAAAWAKLCREYPLEVTASKRHDWYRTTGRSGTWVMPDWAAVAAHYDAVHLHTIAYLSAAGTAIHVTDDTASVIAGWAPDETFWFSDRVRHVDAPVVWERQDAAEVWTWTRAQPSTD